MPCRWTLVAKRAGGLLAGGDRHAQVAGEIDERALALGSAQQRERGDGAIGHRGHVQRGGR